MRTPSPLRVLSALAVLSAVPALAQTSVYAIGGFANYGFTHLTASDISYKGATGGVGGGAFVNFPIASRVTVGIDARAAGSPGDNGGFLTGAALRVGFVPHRHPFRPFFQIGGGIVRSSYNDVDVTENGVASSLVIAHHTRTSGAAQFLVGLDIRLTEHFDLRAPEYGAMAGGGSGIAVGTAFLNGGIVYHLRPLTR